MGKETEAFQQIETLINQLGYVAPEVWEDRVPPVLNKIKKIAAEFTKNNNE